MCSTWEQIAVMLAAISTARKCLWFNVSWISMKYCAMCNFNTNCELLLCCVVKIMPSMHQWRHCSLLSVRYAMICLFFASCFKWLLYRYFLSYCSDLWLLFAVTWVPFLCNKIELIELSRQWQTMLGMYQSRITVKKYGLCKVLIFETMYSHFNSKQYKKINLFKYSY